MCVNLRVIDTNVDTNVCQFACHRHCDDTPCDDRPCDDRPCDDRNVMIGHVMIRHVMMIGHFRPCSDTAM